MPQLGVAEAAAKLHAPPEGPVEEEVPALEPEVAFRLPKQCKAAYPATQHLPVTAAKVPGCWMRRLILSHQH